MHPQILRTWPRERPALAIRTHNLFQNYNWKTIHKVGPSMMQKKKKKRLKDFYALDISQADTYWIRPKEGQQKDIITSTICCKFQTNLFAF